MTKEQLQAANFLQDRITKNRGRVATIESMQEDFAETPPNQTMSYKPQLYITLGLEDENSITISADEEDRIGKLTVALFNIVKANLKEAIAADESNFGEL
jgi:hypothetical protein